MAAVPEQPVAELLMISRTMRPRQGTRSYQEDSPSGLALDHPDDPDDAAAAIRADASRGQVTLVAIKAIYKISISANSFLVNA